MDRAAYDVPFTVKEAADFWKVGRTTVANWIRLAGIRPLGYRPGRGDPLVYRFGDLAAAEQRYRTSGMGRPRSTDRRASP